jgi:uncharacterized repeat protein (TIGR03837 family)
LRLEQAIIRSAIRLSEADMRRASWDIFCTVVDNFGDVGVTWRLAKQLAREHGLAVRLWVDELSAFASLCPQADRQALQQSRDGVDVRLWSRSWTGPVDPADVVVEAFACRLPPEYQSAMASRGCSLWLNLEYLSAEDWVGSCHALPSLQPGGVRKYFFFPGFVRGTGGLLRERGLIERRRAFQRDPLEQRRFLDGLGVSWAPEVRLISLFAYENPALTGWLDALASEARRTLLLVPQGRIGADLAAWLGVDGVQPGERFERGNLKVQVLHFLSQDDYDRLLWCCDFNAVRGEDSFLRAQWAGRPLLWHIYPQHDDAHWDKLDAFLALYLQALPAPARAAFDALWRAWNAGEAMGHAWQESTRHESALRRHAERWCSELAAQQDLAAQLVAFSLAIDPE